LDGLLSHNGIGSFYCQYLVHWWTSVFDFEHSTKVSSTDKQLSKKEKIRLIKQRNQNS
jgi:hypothetical protein